MLTLRPYPPTLPSDLTLRPYPPAPFVTECLEIGRTPGCPAGGHHTMVSCRPCGRARLLPLQRFRAPGSCRRRARRPPRGVRGGPPPELESARGQAPSRMGRPRESARGGGGGGGGGGGEVRAVSREAGVPRCAAGRLPTGGTSRPGGGGATVVGSGPAFRLWIFFNILLYFSTDSSQSLAPVLVGPAGQAAAAEGRGLPSWWAGGERHGTAHGEPPPPKV